MERNDYPYTGQVDGSTIKTIVTARPRYSR